MQENLILEDFLNKVKFDQNGLVPVIAQSVETGEILMLAYMNLEALKRTIETKLICYWSRSRKAYWVKGETSGNLQYLEEIYLDCDGDTILVKVKQKGPACHTGEPSCFFKKLVF